MRILVLSDLHNVHYKDWFPFLQSNKDAFEIIVLLGDIEDDYLKGLRESFSEKMIVGVLGNHDDYSLSSFGVKDVNGMIFVYKNLSIVGIDGCVKYKEKAEGPMYTQEENISFCGGLDRAEIVISHNSPHGIHDVDDGVHEGFKGALNYVKQHSPRYFLHGHQHKNKVTRYDDTIIVGIFGGVILDTTNGSIEKVLSALE